MAYGLVQGREHKGMPGGQKRPSLHCCAFEQTSPSFAAPLGTHSSKRQVPPLAHMESSEQRS